MADGSSINKPAPAPPSKVTDVKKLDGVSYDHSDEAKGGRSNSMPEFRISYPFLLSCVGTAALGSLLLGYDLGIISGAIVPIKNEFNLSGLEVEMLTSSITLASILGSFIAGIVADKFGRKKGLLSAAAIFFAGVSSVVSVPAEPTHINEFPNNGIGVGMGLVICPMYCAELSPRRLRGMVTSSNEMFINVGIPLAFLVNLMLAGLPNDWRWMLVSENKNINTSSFSEFERSIPALGLFTTTCFLPESPRWLLKSSRADEAKETVELLVHKDESPSVRQQVVAQTLADMRQDFAGEQITWSQLFSDDKRKFAIGMTFSFFQQIIGTDGILFYAVYTLQEFGVSSRDALVITLIMGIIKLLTTVLSSVIVDYPKVGRRKPLMVGGFICFLGNLSVAIAAIFSNGAGGLIFGALTFIGGFGLSYGPLCWLILAEMFSGPYRSKALSFGRNLMIPSRVLHDDRHLHTSTEAEFVV
eukprot:jgi/Bigna1/145034/aug1.94_g19742